MKEKLRKIYHNSTLATKIRYSYLLLLIPIVAFLIFCFCNLWSSNRKYEDMLNSAMVASEFSLDFKKDYDYETYLLIVENKTLDESKLGEMLKEANRIVDGLEELTDSKENRNRLASAKKYLNNLQIYKERIEQNLKDGNKYENNIEIWENDVQIVTALMRETIFNISIMRSKIFKRRVQNTRIFYADDPVFHYCICPDFDPYYLSFLLYSP